MDTNAAVEQRLPAAKVLAFATDRPVPYRARDAASGMDLTVSLSCAGEIRWRVTDGRRFREHCSPDGSGFAEFEEILRREVLTALLPVLSALSEGGVPWEDLPGKSGEIGREVEARLAPGWGMRGVRPEEFRLTGASVSEQDEAMLRRLREQAELLDPAKAAEKILRAKREAFRAAGGWFCPECGTRCDRKFCPNCGQRKPERSV